MVKLSRFKSDSGRTAFLAAYEVAQAGLPHPHRQLDIETRYGSVRTYIWPGRHPDEVPVLLLPGMTAGAPMWAENLPSLLASGRTFIAIDALGDAGMSVQRVPIRSQDEQAEWLKELAQQLDLTRIHLVGHSFGGAAAANFAVREPAYAVSLALLEPVFTLGWPPISTFAWATMAILPLPASWRDTALARLGGVPKESMSAGSPIGDLIAAASVGFESALPTPRPLTDGQLARLTMPTYIAIGGKSSLAGKHPAARAAVLRSARLETWPGATHSLPMQERDALAGRLINFWRSADYGEPQTTAGE